MQGSLLPSADMTQEEGRPAFGNEPGGRTLSIRLRSLSGGLPPAQLSISLLFFIAFFLMPTVWHLSPLAGSVLTFLTVLLARARFQPKVIVVKAERLTIWTYNGYSRVVSLQGLHRLRSAGGAIELTCSQADPFWLFLRKRSARALVAFFVAETRSRSNRTRTLREA